MTTNFFRNSIFTIIIFLWPVFSALGENYWQQEVNYKIDIAVLDDLRTITGRIDIEYINNSPDALDRIYIKAFPNAIQKGSYADQKLRWMNNYSFAALKPKQEGSLELTEIKSQTHLYSSISLDNTIYTVYLNKSLQSGDTLKIAFNFKTILPNPHNFRMGVEKNTYKAAYWYPQVCVYDHKMGWVNSQYIGWGETYGDFGDFDVTISAPEDQIVAASGVLVNESEVLPDSLRLLYDIKSFYGEKSTWPQFRFEKNKTKTWHYVAERVNDFAFTYSNDFCIDSDTTGGVEVVAYALRKKARGWENAVLLGKQSIETHSETMYPYQWPVIRICDAFSGMEYPMITNCGGEGPSPRFALLLYHEIGHQWFMGQVGSNQSDRPFLDEGFTTHIEHIAQEKYYGREGNYDYFTNWYQKKFAPLSEDRDSRGFRPLLLLMKQGFDKQMVFSYDQGEEYFPYRVSAYYKCAAMHYSFRSILGDSAYFAAMHHYCEKWFFKHPYEEDFVQAMEEATGLQLDQYLYQWFYTRYRLDYAFDSKKTTREENRYSHHIKLKRPGKFVAPVDMAVIWEQGDTTFYTIAPEGMKYQKPGYVVLPEWPQFRRLNDRYECTITAQRNIKKVVLDPYNLLLDIDRTNNSSGFGWPTEVRLDNMFYDRTPVNQYALRIRPDFWYDDANGVQIGLHSHGSYLESDKKFSLDTRFGTRSERGMIDFSYSTPFSPFGNHSDITNRILRADRRTYISSKYEKKFKAFFSRPDFDLISLELSYLNVSGEQRFRSDQISDDISKYFSEPNWDLNWTDYAVFRTGRLRTFRYGAYSFSNVLTTGGYDEDGKFRGFIESFHNASLTLTRGGKRFLNFKAHLLGTAGEPPSHFINHLSRVKQVTSFTESKVFRSPGTFPTDWADDFYLYNGLVRGYQDRAVYMTESYGGGIELTLPDLLIQKSLKKLPLLGKFLSGMKQSLFAEGAYIEMENKEQYYPSPIGISETAVEPGKEIFYSSAGVSITFPPVWSQHRVRVDFPFYLNKPLADEDKFEFRFSVAWILPAEF